MLFWKQNANIGISYLVMRNSICMISSPSSHIVFLQKNICCFDRFEGLFLYWACSRFSERFQRLQCLLSRLSQSVLLFKDNQSLLSCGDYQCHLLFTFQRLSESFVLQRLSMSSTLLFFFKTITVFFSFRRLSESSAETINVT